MADTIGSLIDKLATVNNKMFWNQEFLYELRAMSPEEFVEKYEGSKENLEDLFEKLKKVVDLNLQRQALILEVDRMLVSMIVALGGDPSQAHRYVIDQHKTLNTEDE